MSELGKIKSSTILCIPYTHTISHISRPLLIAQELRDRGHEIVFAGESPRIKYIQQEGFEVLPLYEPDPEVLYGNIREGRVKFVSDTEIQRMIDADTALYNELKPDLVLTDGRFTAPISTHISGLTHIAIVNVSSTEYRALPYIPFFQWMPSQIIGRDTDIWRKLDSLNLKIEMTIFDNVMNVFKKLSKRYGLHKTVTATNCLTGKDATLLADIPEYFPAKKLPPDYHYIGPLTWKSNFPEPPWWPLEKDGKPLIYVTMGSTGVKDFFHLIYDLLKKSDMKAVVTTGGQTQNLPSIPGKLHMEDYINGDLIMEACDLVVCHGGNGTIYQALQYGKPVIGIPTIPDQKFNMRRVEAMGLGRSLSWKQFSKKPASLINLISLVMKDNSFYQNASKMQEIIKHYDSAGLASDIIENYSSKSR
jgi:UDP:flavonoid glycosyltransferase YjiC (YdhE family)